MTNVHAHYKFSATCKTSDLAVLHCLRALCHYAEKYKLPNIGWGGTGEAAWRASGGQVTFRWTKLEYREQFTREAERLLGGRWSIVRTHDNDPAKPIR